MGLTNAALYGLDLWDPTVFGEVGRHGMRKCRKKAEKVGRVSREDRPKVDTPGGALPPEP